MSIKAEIINKFAKSFDNIKPFKKNTLSYVGIAFQFDSIVDFDSKQTLFYSEVKNNFPYKSERPISQGSLMLTISPDKSQFGFNQQSESYTEYIYKDDKDVPTMRFIASKRKIDFQCIDPQKNYNSFKDFLDKAMNIFETFCKVYEGKLNLMGVVLRKINKIEFNEEIKYLNKDLFYEPKLFDDYLNTNSYKEFSTIDESNEVIEVRSGIIKNRQTGDSNKLVIYDFAIKQDNPSKLNLEKDYLEKMLKEFSRKIYNLYCYCVGEEYINEVLK